MKSMAVFALLAFLSVDAAPMRYIKQIKDSAEKLKEDNPEMMKKKYVDSGFDHLKCECKDFRFAQEILRPIFPKTNKLRRALDVYTKRYQDHPAPVSTSTSVHQYRLETLVDYIIRCSQVHMSHVNKQCGLHTTGH